MAIAVGRIWSRSAAIGLNSRCASGAVPNSAACSCAMKLNVTHSASPAAASTRRATARRVCRGVNVAGGTIPLTGRDTGGTASSPRSRNTSSIRSHSGSISARPAAAAASFSALKSGDGSSAVFAATSLRQGGTATVTASASRLTVRNPSLSSDATASSAGTSSPPRSRNRANRSVAVRCQAGSAPAATTSLGSPPHRSITICVAASSASGSNEGSMPRSNRCRASDVS